MGKSARVLGEEFGRSAREMNRLLRTHGYLHGEPGAYGLTEKGERYAEEVSHSRGTGGYAHYNRHWETRTWSDETAAALAADIEASDVEDHPDLLDPVDEWSSADDADETARVTSNFRLPTTAVVAVVAVSGFLVIRYGKPVWEQRVKPAARRLRERLAGERTPAPYEDEPA